MERDIKRCYYYMEKGGMRTLERIKKGGVHGNKKGVYVVIKRGCAS